MAIGSVIERGIFLTVYDERGRQISVIPFGPGDVLRGYTATMVSIRRGNFVVTYDEHGRHLGMVAAG
jgi:hypothetical protein